MLCRELLRDGGFDDDGPAAVVLFAELACSGGGIERCCRLEPRASR